jgi:hypothetical protein
MSLTNYECWTSQDAVDHVLDAVTAGDADARRIRNARRAVLEAYDDLINYRNWSYYYRRLPPITTVAAITTGTLAYTQSTRTVTLSGVTIDSSIEFYELMVGRVRYEIDKYLSPTTFTLTERANPGADLAAGTTYSLQRAVFSLPDDFICMGSLVDAQSPGRMLTEVTQQELLQLNRTITTVNLPWVYATGPHQKYSGGQAITFGPTPNAARTYDAMYRSRGTRLNVWQVDTGLVTLTNGSATVSCDTASFTQAHVGCVLRVSGTTDPPTSRVGNSLNLDNPYAFQGVVRSVENSTSLTLQQAADQAFAGAPFTLSSRLDIVAGTMLTALLRMAEARMAALEGRDDRAERDAEARVALVRAAEADNTSFPSNATSPLPMRLGDFGTSFGRSLSSEG